MPKLSTVNSRCIYTILNTTYPIIHHVKELMLQNRKISRKMYWVFKSSTENQNVLIKLCKI